MKNIVKSFLSIALVASLISCEDEQDLLFLSLQKIRYYKIGYFHFFNFLN